MSTINQRTNPDMIRSLEEEVIHIRGRIREAESVLLLKAHPGWQQLRGNVQSELDSVESELDKFDVMTDRQILLKLKERKDFRWMVNVVEKVEEGLPKLHQALAIAEGKLAEKKAKSGAGHE